MHTNMSLTFGMAWDPHGVYGKLSSSSPWSDPFTDSPILILAPPKLLQTLLGYIWRIFRRIFDNWAAWNCVVSRTTLYGLTPLFWPFHLFYRHPTSRFNLPNYIDHLYGALNGVWRPGKPYCTPFLPCPPTQPHIPLSFASGTLHMSSPPYTPPVAAL